MTPRRTPGTGRAAVIGLAAATALVSASCGREAASNPPAGSATPSGVVTVFAAASLTESFTRIAAAVEAEHPEIDVVLNFAGSSGLAAQVAQGAPADVFAAASTSTMRPLVEDGLVGQPSPFAANRLQIAVPPGNPGQVEDLADLTRPELTLALCAPQVPCGAAAAAVFDAAGLTPAPDTLEQDVKGALSKAVLGEVDAALVYRTDVRAAGDDVEGIDVPEADVGTTTYPISVLSDAPNQPAARTFVGWVLSPEGQTVLREAGFDPAVIGEDPRAPRPMDPSASP